MVSNRLKRNKAGTLFVVGLLIIGVRASEVVADFSSGKAWFEFIGITVLTWLSYDNFSIYRRRSKKDKCPQDIDYSLDRIFRVLREFLGGRLFKYSSYLLIQSSRTKALQNLGSAPDNSLPLTMKVACLTFS